VTSSRNNVEDLDRDTAQRAKGITVDVRVVKVAAHVYVYMRARVGSCVRRIVDVSASVSVMRERRRKRKMWWDVVKANCP